MRAQTDIKHRPALFRASTFGAAIIAVQIWLVSAAAGAGTFGQIGIPWPGEDTKFNYQHAGARNLVEILTEFESELGKQSEDFFITIGTGIQFQRPAVTLPVGERSFREFFLELVDEAGLHYWYDTENLKGGEPDPTLSVYLGTSEISDEFFESTVSPEVLEEYLGQSFPVTVRKNDATGQYFVQGPGSYASYVREIAGRLATGAENRRGATDSARIKAPAGKPAPAPAPPAPAPASAPSDDDEIEVWIFPLKHAWARDIDLPIWLEADQSMMIPGVASILRDVFAPKDDEAGAKVFGTSFAPGLGMVGAVPGGGAGSSLPAPQTTSTQQSTGFNAGALLRLNESTLGDQRVPGLRGSGLASNRIRAQRFSDLNLPTNVVVVNGDNQQGNQQAGPGGVAGFFSTLADMAPSTVSGDGEWQQTIFADPRNNSVIVADKKSRYAMYEKLIDQLDRPRDLVEISVAIIDINVGTGFTWGVDYLTAGMTEINRAKTFYGGNFNGSQGIGDLIDDAGDLVTDAVKGQGLVASGLLIGDSASLFARVQALEEENLAQVLSRPSVLSLDNGNAVIDDETTFHVKVAGNEEVDLFPVPVKTRLRVNPHIFNNARGEPRVRLDVYIKDGAIVGTVSDPDPDLSDIPVISESKVSTEAVLRPNQSLMVGGRYRVEQMNAENRIPIAGRIPVLGLAFKDKDVQTKTLQRMFIITPKILGAIPPPGAGEFPQPDFPNAQK